MRINVPFVKFESKVPVIKLKLGDKDLYALLDTGSESTLIDEKLIKDKNIKSKNLDSELGFVGMNGSSEKKSITVLCGEFEAKGSKILINAIAADLSAFSTYFQKSYGSDVIISMVIGDDFLEGHCANIDMEQHFVGLFL